MRVCAYLRVFVVNYYKMCVFVVYYFVCFNIAYYFVNTLLPRSSFCYRMSRTPAEEAENSLTKIISKNELNLQGILHRGHNNQIKLLVSL